MADTNWKHGSSLLVDIGDVSDNTSPLIFVIGDAICYPSASPMAIASVSQILHTHIQISSLVTNRHKHYRQKIKHSTFRYHKFKIQHSTSIYKINIQQAVTSRYKTINSFKTTNSFTRTNFAVLSVHLRPWKQVCLSMIRRWIIAVELSLLRDHLIHDEGGQLFSNGVQIIIA